MNQAKVVRRLFLLIAAAGFCVMPQPASAEVIARSGPAAVSLLEVYSSEGCSSCPPGETWLSTLTEDAGLWTQFVPVAFHVDYWDYLGWKDPLSQKRFSDRQRDYAGFWQSSSVYTPGFVLNGEEWQSWHRQAPGVPERKGKPGELVVEGAASGEYKVWYKPAKGALPENVSGLVLHAALLGSGITTDVRAGENAGRKLKHDFAVLDYVEKAFLPPASGDDVWNQRARLEAPSQYSGASRPNRSAIAVWVSRADDPTPLQAAGAYLHKKSIKDAKY